MLSNTNRQSAQSTEIRCSSAAQLMVRSCEADEWPEFARWQSNSMLVSFSQGILDKQNTLSRAEAQFKINKYKVGSRSSKQVKKKK